MFASTQTERLKVGGGELFEKDITDLEGTDTVKDWLSKTASEMLALGAENIDENDVNGIKGILLAIKVQVMVSVSPLKWQTVIVKPGTFHIKETRERVFRIEFDIIKPDIFVQSQ